ncbi:MAG TPA: hypothetical protein VGM88_32525 [Kofleriaceae bacterium]
MHARAIGRIVFVLAAACTGRTVTQPPAPQPAALRVLDCKIAELLPANPRGGSTSPAGTQAFAVDAESQTIEQSAAPVAPITVTGDLDETLVLGVVRIRGGGLRKCYADALARDPAIEGSATVEFSVLADGSTITNGVSMRGLDMPMRGCLSAEFERMTFPPLPGRAPVHVIYPLRFAGSPPPDAPATAEQRPDAWTPFARARVSKLQATPPLGGLVAELRARHAALDACFGPAAPTGSLRVMFGLDRGGARSVRVGGLGDAAGEACVAKALADVPLHVPEPQADEDWNANQDIACDLTRGDARPWRVTPAAYDVLAVSRTGDSRRVVHGTVLVLADPDATGEQLAGAFGQASDADATVFAVRDGDGAVFVGATGNRRGEVDGLWDAAKRPSPALHVTRDSVAACSGDRDLGRAPLDATGELDALVGAIAEICRARPCGAIRVSLDPAATASATLEVASALRLAGITRVAYGSRVSCSP